MATIPRPALKDPRDVNVLEILARMYFKEQKEREAEEQRKRARADSDSEESQPRRKRARTDSAEALPPTPIAEKALDPAAAPPTPRTRAEAADAIETNAKAAWACDYKIAPEDFLTTYNMMRRKESQRRTLTLEHMANGDVQPILMLKCVECGESKPCLPSHFPLDGNNKKRKVMPGREYYQNSRSNPCKECMKTMMAKKRRTSPAEWLRTLMSSYDGLRPVGPTAEEQRVLPDNPEGWAMQRMMRQGADLKIINRVLVEIIRMPLCAITNLRMTWGGLHNDFCMSINNKNMADKGQKNHQSKHCELIIAELNVQQHDAIPDLVKGVEEWIVKSCPLDQTVEAKEAATIEADKIRRNYNNSPKANGVTANPMTNQKEYNKQYRNLDLKTIIRQMLNSHYRRDEKKGRNNNLTEAYIVNLLVEKPRCHYSGALMTTENGPLRFSIDRIDNSRGHEEGNIVLCCRLLNSAAGMTKEKCAEIMLSQDLVPLSLEVRAAWEARL